MSVSTSTGIRRYAPPRTREPDMRELLLGLGIGDHLATIAIPYLSYLPQTTDAASQGVMLIVAGIQQELNRKGWRVRVDGQLGPRTARAIAQATGPGWSQRTWGQLAGDVAAARPRSRRDTDESPVAAGGFVTDALWSPVGILGLAFAAWYVFGRQ